MTEEKKNRVDLDGGGGDFDYTSNEVDFSEPQRSAAGMFIYVIMAGLILILIFVSWKFFNEAQILKKQVIEKTNQLTEIEHEKNKKLYGTLHLEIEDPEKGLGEEKRMSAPGVEIYINGEQQKSGTGVNLGNYDIKNTLNFEFKKPGFYPVKLQVGSCNWIKRGKDKFVYENRDIHLAIDENGMMALEAAKKERDKEERLRKNTKKKRRRR